MSKNVIYDENAHQFALSNESGGGGNVPLGTDRQVLGYVNGEPQAVTLGWMQFSDLPTPPPFEVGVLSGTTFNTDGTAMFYFHELNSGVNATAKVNTIPVYGAGGVLKVNNGIADDDAVNLSYLKQNYGKYLGLYDTIEDLELAHPYAYVGDRAEVKDVDSAGDIHRHYYWSDMQYNWMLLNKPEDDVYSTSEIITNKMWLNGKKVYRRVFTDIEINDDSSKLVSLAGIGITEITTIDYTVMSEGILRKSINTLDISATNTSVTITPTETPASTTNVTVILEYTK